MCRSTHFFTVAAAVAINVLLSAGSVVQAQSPFNNTLPASPMGQRGAGLPANALPARGGLDRSSFTGAPTAQPVYGGNNGGMTDPGLSGATGSSVPMSLENVGPDYKLRRGDMLSYQVREDRDPMLTLPVTDSGEIEPPYLGRRINAVGKTCGQLQTEVKAALERELYVRATVQLGLNRVSPVQSRGRVYMTGQIRNIGPLELPTDEALTVSNAILRAGGFRDFADQNNVRLIRKDGPSGGVQVLVKRILEGKRNYEDPVLQPGDTILVKEKLINF